MARQRRSRFTSKGWWRWQRRRLAALPVNAIQRLVARYRKRFPKQLSDDEQWEVWRQQLDRIHTYIADVLRHRMIFREITEMLQQHPTLREDFNAGYVYVWLRDIYAHYISMAIRREIDKGTGVVNLRQLLWQISKRPRVLSRDRYLRHFADLPPNRHRGMEH